MNRKSIREAVLSKVRKAVSDFSLLKPGDRVLVAVSGGPDSTALLLVLQELRSELKLSLAVFHLNHMLREDAERDEAFVRELSERLSLRCFAFREDVGAVARAEKISLEEAGRKVRYRLMEDVARREGFERVALGHTMSDVAETLVMRLVTHSSFEALKSIPPRRGMFVRPLIYLSRSELLSYLNFMGQDYCVDETNTSGENIRSIVRNRIMPEIRQINPSFEEKAFALARTVSEFSDFLDRLAKREAENLVSATEGIHCLDAKGILEVHPVLARKVVYDFLVGAGVSRKKITSETVERVLRMAKERVKSLDLSGDLKAVFSQNSIKIVRKESALTLPEVELKVPGRTAIPEAEVEIVAELLEEKPEDLGDGKLTCVLDAEKVGKKVLVRGFKPGDRMVPLGMRSEKKVHDLFVDEKVPREKRQVIPLLVAENGRICWIPTLRVSEEFKVNGGTRAFYRFRLFKRGGKQDG